MNYFFNFADDLIIALFLNHFIKRVSMPASKAPSRFKTAPFKKQTHAKQDKKKSSTVTTVLNSAKSFFAHNTWALNATATFVYSLSQLSDEYTFTENTVFCAKSLGMGAVIGVMHDKMNFHQAELITSYPITIILRTGQALGLYAQKIAIDRRFLLTKAIVPTISDSYQVIFTMVATMIIIIFVCEKYFSFRFEKAEQV
jgi:hypothetical protein